MIAPESPEATINGRGQLTAPAELSQWEPQTYQRELADQAGEWRAVDGGPGHELSAGDPRPKRFDLTYTQRPYGQWTPDEFSGIHAFVPWSSSTVDAHIGYQQPWGVDLPNDIDPSNGVRVPWDYGLSAPRQSPPFRV